MSTAQEEAPITGVGASGLFSLFGPSSVGCYQRQNRLTLSCSEAAFCREAMSFASSFYRALGFGRSVQAAFDQGIASLLLEGIPQEDVPDLLGKDGVDANTLEGISGDVYD